MRTTETFEQHLRKSNLSENTIHSYLWTVDFYHAHYDEVNKENLLAYKGYLMEFFKPKTVNLRIQAMNKYLDFLHRDRLRLRAVKVQQKNFLENVISNADYNFLKKQLKKDSNMEWYFVVWYLAATGALLAPGAHSQFGSGKNTQFEPEQRANPFENVFSKTAVFPPPAIAETDL